MLTISPKFCRFRCVHPATERRDLPECRARVTLGDWSAELHLARATPEAADLCGGVTIPAAVRRSVPEGSVLRVEPLDPPEG